MAAAIGSTAARRSVSAPAVISQRISRPTSKKKTASSPSEHHCPTLIDSHVCEPRTSVDSMAARYRSPSGEFAHAIAAAAARSSTKPPDAGRLAKTRPACFTPAAMGRSNASSNE